MKVIYIHVPLVFPVLLRYTVFDSNVYDFFTSIVHSYNYEQRLNWITIKYTKLK